MSSGESARLQSVLEKALLESEKRYRALYEDNPSMYFTLEPDTRVSSVNEFGASQLGYAVEELTGQPVAAVIHEEDRQAVLDQLEESLANPGKVYCWRFRKRRRDGSVLWVEEFARTVERADGTKSTLVVCQDATDRIRSAEALRESEERFRATFELAAVGIALVGPDGSFLRVNDKLCDILGYGSRELKNLTFQAITHPDDLEANLEDLRRALAREIDTYSMEKRYIRKDQSLVWAHLTVSLVREADGEPKYFISVIEDISKRKQAEKALRESEARYRSLVEQLPVATYRAALDERGSALYVSPQIEKLTGFAPSEWCVRPSLWQRLIHVEDRREVLAALNHSLSTYEPFVAQYRLMAKGGGEIIVRDEAAVVRDDDGRPLFLQGIMVDVTERNRLEQELLKARKLESVGALAGGIAHDFNNLLMGILGNISLAKLETRPDSPAFIRLDKAEKAALRATGLTQQLRTFSKGGAPVKKTASIRELLRETATFVLSGSNVQARFDIAEDLWTADVDEGQISQVIENLVINATQSMAGGGVLRIDAKNTEIDANQTISLHPGKYLEIAVRDQGAGIDPQHLEKIFDPYFSTKEAGSGLGLATSYAIVGKHGGIISVESEPGQGSKFTIYLPASATVAEAPGTSATKLRILIVDDEAMVRETVGQMLSSMDYEPWFAENGADAVRMWQRARERGESMDAAIMDLTMPGGIGGTETMRKLLEIDPGAIGIVSTGYSEDPAMTEFEHYGFRGRIAKPYRVQDLSLVLKSVLEPRETGSARDRKNANDPSGRDSGAIGLENRLREDHP